MVSEVAARAPGLSASCLGQELLSVSGGCRYARRVTVVVSLPDDVAALLEERAVQRGITVPELICELAELSANRQALEAFIGCADVPVDRPFDIHQARAEVADELLKDHDRLSSDLARGSSRSGGLSFGFD